MQRVQKFRFFLQLTVLTGVQRVQRGIDAGKRDIDREIVGQNEHQRQHHRKNHHNHHLKQAALGAVQHGEHAGRVVHHNIPVIGLQLLINVNPSALFQAPGFILADLLHQAGVNHILKQPGAIRACQTFSLAVDQVSKL